MVEMADRIAVYGDVHGHRIPFLESLAQLGVSRDFRMPDDLVVIQVGDLVHRGPDSLQLLEAVGQLLENNPFRYIQLIGNHEAQYLYKRMFENAHELEPAGQRLLHDLFNDGLIHAAVGITSDQGEEILATHAGVSPDVYRNILGSPKGIDEVAARIEAGISHSTPWLWSPGAMLTGRRDPYAGPLWAEAMSEVYVPWFYTGANPPFSQIHGHSSPVLWSFDGTPPSLRDFNPLVEVHVDIAKRHSIARVQDRKFVGIDPCHGRYRASPSWAPLQLNGTVHPPRKSTDPSLEWLR